MNLWFRVLRVFLKSFRCPPIEVFGESRLSFRVWPTDLDINLHMNNGRYLTLMDLGRTHFMSQLRLLWKLPLRKWYPVVGSVQIEFMRSLDPFQKFDIVTRLLTWDEKWFYLEQRFESNGRTMARAVLKALFLGSGGRIGPEEIIRLVMDEIPEKPQRPRVFDTVEAKV